MKSGRNIISERTLTSIFVLLQIENLIFVMQN